MSLRFGTDGVRGVANTELTPELVLALGRAAARVFAPDRFVVGMDTRLSGPMLSAALMAGMAAEGVGAVSLGVIPTPGVAWVAADEGIPGAMVSASHNPFGDNGVKFFAPGGRKLTEALEARIEAELDRILAHRVSGPAGDGVGTWRASDGARRYVDALVAHLPPLRLAGLSVVLDCAHGAAGAVAPPVFESLGAEVTVINAAPDGTNINDRCGSTHPGALQHSVVEQGADVGLAFDGDADRVLAVDHRGNLVDGDQLIAICAVDRRRQGRLPDDTVVLTVMANLGLRQALTADGIRWIETDVGDRNVLEALEEGGWAMGGEQSGHVIFRDLATTGDGILTGLEVLDVMARSGASLAELAGVMTRRPQVLRNVTVSGRGMLDANGEMAAARAAVEADLGSRGRVLIRPSGTEPVIRVMVEAATLGDAEAACATLCDALIRSLGAATTG